MENKIAGQETWLLIIKNDAVDIDEMGCVSLQYSPEPKNQKNQEELAGQKARKY